jgi:16S rRNA U516 pseudouridylate synthase RsuA-like enzyme
MLLTNDNGWIHVLTHPAFGHRKKYRVIVEGIPSEQALKQLKEGLQLPDERTRSVATAEREVSI